MRIVLLIALLFGSFSHLHGADPTYATPESAAASDPDFAIQGEYVGPARAMQVVALGDGEFETVIYAGGLPGAGWDKSPPRRISLDEDAVLGLVESNQMKRVERRSPTLGLEPPADAIVLFDGTSKTVQAHWKNGRLTDDGLLMEGTTSIDTFDDFSLHLEFRTPFMPTARGQARGNSGVYYQGRYETQILDSFGLAGKMNETGGIYTTRDPDLNMCFPPLTWQTYDADFNAARYDDDGKKIADATLTVRLNGVVVQREVPLPHKTRAAPNDEGPQAGPIYLQDHGNPVRFRNIWAIRRDAETEALRPRVPGFERFVGHQIGAPNASGRLLINELGCNACHPGPSLDVSRKQAPILTSVGSRIRPDYLLKFIRDPHAAKPGTMMPAMLAGMSAEQATEAAQALTSFLLSTGSIGEDAHGDPEAGGRGRRLYHMIGCTACHRAQDGDALPDATSVPLGSLDEKYTLTSLTEFLKAPHAIRPSGRMPSFEFDQAQATDVATYLLRDVVLGDRAVNMKAAFYEGSWEQLPDFDSLTPYLETETYGLDLKASGKTERFGARYDTFFIAPKDANYNFTLRSDDGSRLLIDGNEHLIADGVHPMSGPSGSIQLKKGPHRVRVEYFELAGEEGIKVQVEGGGIKRCQLETIAVMDPEHIATEPLIETQFQADPKLASRGRELFTSLGCAACHELKQGDTRITSTIQGRALSQLDIDRGACLAVKVPAGVPDYRLSPLQRGAIVAAVTELQSGQSKAIDDASRIHQTMATMNCYACHERNQIGGVEKARDHVFTTTMKEMGDEGRLPPPLTGVGDKLRRDYIENLLDKGADERPYMKVKMPGFGRQNVPGLLDWVIGADKKTQAHIEHAQQPLAKIKSSGRFLAGNKGLSCVKCHTFGGKGAPGIGAIDMQRMTARLREDWFHRYLMSPTTYRPGTRMPSSFPDGKSVVTDLYEGHPPVQIDALWQFLADGTRAREPIGVQQEMIELVAKERPVIYRNFIEGLSPRGIAVGYPTHLNIAWDAGTMSLARIWKGAFIDASKHWVGRGPGTQQALGDEMLSLNNRVTVARLERSDADWPKENARQLGYQFQGYRLNQAGQPTFEYRAGDLQVTDHPVPQSMDKHIAVMQRELTLSGPDASQGIVLRWAEGKKIVREQSADAPASDASTKNAPSGQTYRIDDRYSIWVNAPAEVVNVAGMQELRSPVSLTGGKASVAVQYRW